MKLISLTLVLLLAPVSGFTQSVQWDVSLWGKPRAFTEHVEKLAELVSRKTNGDFQLNISYGGLSKPQDNLDGITAGRFEMAQFCAGFHPDKNPAITVLELPYLGVTSLSQERMVSQYLYRHPAVVQDFARLNAVTLMPSPIPQYNLIGTGPTPATLQDLAGVSVRATGGIGDAMQALNAVPSYLAASDVGPALEAGEIEAAAFAPHSHMTFRTVTTARWWTTNLDPGTVNCPVVVNADAVLALSPEHLDALYGSINPALDHYVENYEYNMTKAWQPLLSLLEIDRVSFDAEELAEFKDRAGHEAALTWIEDMEQSGLPAVDLYRLVKIALSGINPEEFIANEGIVAARTESATSATNPQPVDTQESIVKKQLESLLTAYAFDKSPTNKVERIQQLPGQMQALPARDAVEEELLPIAETESFNEDTARGSDAVNTTVDWQYSEQTTVGSAMEELAGFIGYQLVIDNESAASLYARNVPTEQRQVDSISVGEGFNILAGRGFVTILDHTGRTVRHLPVQPDVASRNLADCPDVYSYSIPGDVNGVILRVDGTECRYNPFN